MADQAKEEAKKNPHYDGSQEYKRVIQTNPFRQQASPVPEGYEHPADRGVQVETQDVKSNEVNTDEPKKRRKSRSKSTDNTSTSDKQTDSNS